MIAVIDYGVGNLFSLSSSLAYLGLENKITRSARELDEASHIILPGVGAFGDAMEKLASTGLVPELERQAENGKPLLGICLGMQLLFEKSYEYGEHAGRRCPAACQGPRARRNRISRRRALVTRCRTSAGTACIW